MCGFSAGFTLIESLMASVVLAIAVVGVAGTLAASHAQAAVTEETARATALCRQLIEEIASKPVVATDATAGWPTQTDRALYDSIGDYSGYSELNPPLMLSGATTGVAEGFSRSVTLTYPTTLFGQTVTAGDWVLISVRTKDASGRSITLNRLVAATILVR
jgi:prepilin-type N-terminal cleavage/methylation domain-containing protein